MYKKNIVFLSAESFDASVFVSPSSILAFVYIFIRRLVIFLFGKLPQIPHS